MIQPIEERRIRDCSWCICAAFGESMAEPFQNLGTKLSESLNEPTDTFRNGRALSLVELMEEMFGMMQDTEDEGSV